MISECVPKIYEVSFQEFLTKNTYRRKMALMAYGINGKGKRM